MAMFKAFKPSGMEKIARSMGYQGGMDKFQDFLATDPARQQQMDMYTNKAMQMAKGGVVKKFQTGGTVGGELPVAPIPKVDVPKKKDKVSAPDFTIQQMYAPGLVEGAKTKAMGVGYDPSQDIAAETGNVYGQVATPTAMALTAQAEQPTATGANLMQADTVSADVDAAINATSAAQANPQDPRAQITAAQQTQSSVGNLQAAQGNAFLINNPIQRQLQNGELISGTGVDAAKAATLTAQTQAAAATANPSAQTMVANQLDGLMQQFQGANPPAWAAGAMRSATAVSYTHLTLPTKRIV